MIKGLHHNAYRCRDSEQTRRFYEDFLGLPLAGSLEIRETKTGRATSVLHTFYRLGDGSFLAFFEAPGQSFEFEAQHAKRPVRRSTFYFSASGKFRSVAGTGEAITIWFCLATQVWAHQAICQEASSRMVQQSLGFGDHSARASRILIGRPQVEFGGQIWFGLVTQEAQQPYHA